jgi:hypothetical protein
VGTAPLSEPIAVEIGAHTIKVRAPDGTTDAQSVTVLRGEREVARFVRAVPAPAPAPAPVSTEPPPSPPVASPPAPQAPPAPPPREEPPSVSSEPEAMTPASARHGSEFWPANKVPIYIGAGLVVAGAGVAIGMLAAKQSAQDKANSTAASVQGRHGMVCGATGVCKCPAPAGASANLVSVCSQYANDQDQINQDATAANIAIGVGIAALVGTVVYWVVARKQHAVETTLVPIVGPKYGGLSISAPF